MSNKPRNRCRCPGSDSQELDLSDEWEAIATEAQESPAAAQEVPAAVTELDPVVVPEAAASEPETVEAAAPPEPAQEIVAHADAEPEVRRAGAALRESAQIRRRKIRRRKFQPRAARRSPSRSLRFEIVEEPAEATPQPVQPVDAEALPEALLDF